MVYLVAADMAALAARPQDMVAIAAVSMVMEEALVVLRQAFKTRVAGETGSRNTMNMMREPLLPQDGENRNRYQRQ